MTPQLASALLETTLPALQAEFKTTARVLAAVPDDQAGYKPHEKNMSAGELVLHIAYVEVWFLEAVIKGEFSTPDDSAFQALGSPSRITAEYQARIPGLLEQLPNLSAEHLAKEVQFYSFNMPLISYLTFMTNHTIHHRGQLSVYLRPMGAKVPSIYGGSADEPMTAAEGA